MGRRWKVFVILLLIASNMLLLGQNFAESSSKDYTLFLNEEIPWRGGEVRTISGVNYIPLRSFFEALGAKVTWDPFIRKVTVDWDNYETFVYPGQRYVVYNRRFIMFGQRALILNNQTYIPIEMAWEVANAYIFFSDISRVVWVLPRSNLVKPHSTIRGRVTEVISGDTMKIMYNGVIETVKLIGVNAPLATHLPGKGPELPFHNQAHIYTRARLQGQDVTLVFDIRERNKRNEVLAYVYQGNRMYNLELLERGLGFIALSPPNLKFRDDLFAAQNYARDTERGLWRVVESDLIVPPWAQYAGTISSTNFHRTNCSHIQDAPRNQVFWFEDLDHAMFFGLKPCPKCFW